MTDREHSSPDAQSNDPGKKTAPPEAVKTKLEEVKRRIERAEEVVIDQQGRLYAPGDSNIRGTSPQAKTVLKPQRWFAIVD